MSALLSDVAKAICCPEGCERSGHLYHEGRKISLCWSENQTMKARVAILKVLDHLEEVTPEMAQAWLSSEISPDDETSEAMARADWQAMLRARREQIEKEIGG